MNQVLIALAEYVATLDKSSKQTTRAEDRVRYEQHLATSARMFEAIQRRAVDELKELVASERRVFGWGYLSGPEGEAAERAFNNFAKHVESTFSSH